MTKKLMENFELPKVSVVIPTYALRAHEYLKNCLKALSEMNYPKNRFEVIVVSSGEFSPFITEDLGRHYHSKERLHFAEAVNKGIELAAIDADFYFILNDDTIPTKDSLLNMVSAERSDERITGPISNCDNGVRYDLFFGYEREFDLIQISRRFFTLKDIGSELPNLFSAKSVYPSGLISQEHICFYAALIPKKIWNHVGPLDEKFKSGQEDIDYCKRAIACGYPVATMLSSLVWHFGGITANESMTDDLRDKNKEYFKEKWNELAP